MVLPGMHSMPLMLGQMQASYAFFFAFYPNDLAAINMNRS